MFYSFSPRNIAPKGLLLRFVLIIIIPVIVAQLLAVYLFYKRHWYNVSANNSHMVAVEVQQLLDNIRHQNLTQNTVQQFLTLKYQLMAPKHMPDNFGWRRKELRIFEQELVHLGIKATAQLEADQVALYIPLQINGATKLVKIMLSKRIFINSTTYIFVLWIIGLTLLLLTVALVFSKNQIKSIVELTKAATAYSHNKEYIYKPSGAKEIRAAGLALLKMKNSLLQEAKRKSQMLAMLSHDLKTPLTKMKLQLALMPEDTNTHGLAEDVNHMQQMINSYLDYLRKQQVESSKIVDLSTWLKEYLKNNWSNENIQLIIYENTLTLPLKLFSFKRVLDNLLNNGLRYGKKILITVKLVNKQMLMTIEDDGPGIPVDERPLVLKPFYKTDTARSHNTQMSNVGLGLAIVNDMVKLHNGTLKLTDSPQLGGLLVAIMLPLTDSTGHAK